MAAEAIDAVSSAMGFETPHQRAVKAHAEVMKQWWETCRDLREQDTKARESMKARLAMAPLRQRRHAPASVALIVSPPKAEPNRVATPKCRQPL